MQKTSRQDHDKITLVLKTSKVRMASRASSITTVALFSSTEKPRTIRDEQPDPFTAPALQAVNKD
jgi:hypothetical protein